LECVVWQLEPQHPGVPHSQPLVSGEVVLQSEWPAWQLAYVQVVPVQAAPLLLSVSQTLPHPAQFAVVVVDVEQPPVLGGAGLQSAKPGLQPLYWHELPLQVAPWLCVVSQTLPHPAQLIVVVVAVSQPFTSGAARLQSAKPGLQPV
jgi:hypothetical protein